MSPPVGGRPRRGWLSGPAWVVLAVLLATTAAGVELARRAAAEEEDRRLEEASSEVALVVATALAEGRSSLAALAGLAAAGTTPEVFEEAALPLLEGRVGGIAALRRSGSTWEVVHLVGRTEPSPWLRALADRAASTGAYVTAVARRGDRNHVGYAVPARGGEVVVVRDIEAEPDQVETLGGETFEDLDLALYAAPEPDDEALVRRTAPAVPITGDRVETPIPAGIDRWLLVARARVPLAEPLTRASPWLTGAAGLLLAATITALVDALARRRAYAAAQVEARTAELEALLRERSELEASARRAGAEAIAANRSKSEFLSRMSHELRTPLNAVLGFAQLLELEDLTPSQRESVDQILKGGRHLLTLIDEVLDISRIETGRLPLSPEAVPVVDALEEVLALMRPLAERHGISLVIEEPGACEAHAFADRQRLKQILLNLLSNAVKYNRVGGRAWVTCRATPDRVAISVHDTGPGIAEEDLDRLFAPFERLGADRSDVEGTGIGLALSRRLAEAMGCTLTVESEPGRGSTFTLDLPRVEAPDRRLERLGHLRAESAGAGLGAAAADGDGEASGGGGDGRGGEPIVLYIEDNPSNYKLVERLVARRNLRLLPAAHGRLGLDLARQHRPAAVLLDLHLPDLPGEEVLRELRDDPATAHIPVLVVSADATPGQVQRLLAAGAAAYLTKPIDAAELLDRLGSLVGPR